MKAAWPGHYGVAVKPLLIIIMIILDIVDLEEFQFELS